MQSWPLPPLAEKIFRHLDRAFARHESADLIALVCSCGCDRCCTCLECAEVASGRELLLLPDNVPPCPKLREVGQSRPRKHHASGVVELLFSNSGGSKNG